MGIYEQFKDTVKKIKIKTEDFKENHEMMNVAIAKLIKSLPKPFDIFLEIVWEGIEKDDNSAYEILKILRRFENNNELTFIHITSKIDELIKNDANNLAIIEIGKQINGSNKKIITILNSKLDEIVKISNKTMMITHKTREDIKKIREELQPEISIFRKKLKKLLSMVIQNLKTKNKSHLTNDMIDEVIGLCKKRIENWDVMSLKFATNYLFNNLYKFSEVGSFGELYLIFKDLFSYAYSQRKHLVGIMIDEIYYIMLETWTDDSEIERVDKAAKILLRLGIDFINYDLDVTLACATVIDNIAGDMYAPKLLAKQILLASCIFERSNNSDSQQIVENMIHDIKWNHYYSNDSGKSTYLKNGIKQAQIEKEFYEVNLESFKQKLLRTKINFR